MGDGMRPFPPSLHQPNPTAAGNFLRFLNHHLIPITVWVGLVSIAALGRNAGGEPCGFVWDQGPQAMLYGHE